MGGVVDLDWHRGNRGRIFGDGKTEHSWFGGKGCVPRILIMFLVIVVEETDTGETLSGVANGGIVDRLSIVVASWGALVGGSDGGSRAAEAGTSFELDFVSAEAGCIGRGSVCAGKTYAADETTADAGCGRGGGEGAVVTRGRNRHRNAVAERVSRVSRGNSSDSFGRLDDRDRTSWIAESEVRDGAVGIGSGCCHLSPHDLDGRGERVGFGLIKAVEWSVGART